MGAVFPVRRAGWITAALAVLAGCSNTDDTYDIARALLLPDQQEFDERYQSAARRGTEQLKLALLDFGAASIILLDSQRDGIKTWITPDGGTLSTRDGMVVAMNGFGAGLLATDVSQPLRMVRSGHYGASDRFHTFLTGDDKTVTRTYRCELSDQGGQEIALATGPLQARLVAEDCRSLDHGFQNLYWVNPSNNRIVQTSQWTGDFIGTIATQVVP